MADTPEVFALPLSKAMCCTVQSSVQNLLSQQRVRWLPSPDGMLTALPSAPE